MHKNNTNNKQYGISPSPTLTALTFGDVFPRKLNPTEVKQLNALLLLVKSMSRIGMTNFWLTATEINEHLSKYGRSIRPKTNDVTFALGDYCSVDSSAWWLKCRIKDGTRQYFLLDKFDWPRV